eukprot:TRINITY_DN82138_c0_g1_i1.p1 TRINITY_DN82138_c0_g1~~TRINITY_DN82138_c0_g1_i1.p1  ORF type:complete len:463 (-),score=86.43 TRINITY_DN82138_c0_g1_i1:454-1842(-)
MHRRCCTIGVFVVFVLAISDRCGAAVNDSNLHVNGSYDYDLEGNSSSDGLTLGNESNQSNVIENVSTNTSEVDVVILRGNSNQSDQPAEDIDLGVNDSNESQLFVDVGNSSWLWLGVNASLNDSDTENDTESSIPLDVSDVLLEVNTTSGVENVSEVDVANLTWENATSGNASVIAGRNESEDSGTTTSTTKTTTTTSTTRTTSSTTSTTVSTSATTSTTSSTTTNRSYLTPLQNASNATTDDGANLSDAELWLEEVDDSNSSTNDTDRSEADETAPTPGSGATTLPEEDKTWYIWAGAVLFSAVVFGYSTLIFMSYALVLAGKPMLAKAKAWYDTLPRPPAGEPPAQLWPEDMLPPSYAPTLGNGLLPLRFAAPDEAAPAPPDFPPPKTLQKNPEHVPWRCDCKALNARWRVRCWRCKLPVDVILYRENQDLLKAAEGETSPALPLSVTGEPLELPPWQPV